MNKKEMENLIGEVLCGKSNEISCNKCFKNVKNKKSPCSESKQCRISEKTEEQLRYILSPITSDVFLEACAGSGKTEVVGMKTAYEINKWGNNIKSGIAVLTFTNEATNTIKSRVNQFSNRLSFFPHYIGTLTSFIHGYIAQNFGYKYVPNQGKQGNFSYQLIEKDINIYKNHWLVNYKLPISYVYSNSTKTDVYANQIYYDYRKKDYVLYISEKNKITIKDYYNSNNFQNYLKSLRNKQNNNSLFEWDYIFKEINKIKTKFLESGFANFEDMNNIAFKVLDKDNNICWSLSQKFPLIFIDECQDLSWIEIQVLNKLKEKGTKLHFIGDLNQAIYEFKNADPIYTKSYLCNFEKYALTDNFRSCSPIVDVVNKLNSIETSIKGRNINILNENSVCYLEYSSVNEVLDKYLRILKKFYINVSNSSILVRQNTLKNELICDESDSYKQHLLLHAIMLWTSSNPLLRQEALKLAGQQFQKWFGGAKSKNNYFYPVDLNSVFAWRIFIKSILVECCNNSKLSCTDKKAYSQWYKEAREELPEIFKRNYASIRQYDNKSRDFASIGTYNAPHGTASLNIHNIDTTKMNNGIEISTIHNAKGCSFDSVMVVSTKDLKSSGGHWKQWIDGEGEYKRIGYVASTRPKYLLIWAVYKLKKTDRELLESYGFKDISKVFTTP